MMLACLLIYTYTGHSLRGTAKTLEIFDFLLDKAFGALPNFTTIKTWIEKAGLDVYLNKKLSLDEVYGLIVDGSITVGGQQLMLQLKVPSEHPDHPLTHADTEVVGMKVVSGWPSEKISEEPLSTVEELGKAPSYMLSDNGSNLCKASREVGFAHHRDISHSFGAFLERTYKEDVDFNAFMKSMGETRRYALTSVAYLMPPKQRSIARFMNMFNGVEWTKHMLDNFHKLSNKEKYFYFFLHNHASIIEELYEVMSLCEQVLHICKTEGLSLDTAGRCISLARKHLIPGSDRMRLLQGYILEYFRKEIALLKSPSDVHNISSDIIESTFGFFKERKSPNKNFGVTSFVLTIPLHTKLRKLDDVEYFDVKQRMEATTINDAKEWKREKLLPNQTSKRQYILAS